MLTFIWGGVTFVERPHKDSRSNACVNDDRRAGDNTWTVWRHPSSCRGLWAALSRHPAVAWETTAMPSWTEDTEAARVPHDRDMTGESKKVETDSGRKVNVLKGCAGLNVQYSHSHRVAPQSADFRFCLEFMNEITVKTKVIWYSKVIRLVLFATNFSRYGHPRSETVTSNLSLLFLGNKTVATF